MVKPKIQERGVFPMVDDSSWFMVVLNILALVVRCGLVDYFVVALCQSKREMGR